MIPLALLLNRYTAGAAALAVVAAGAFWYRGELIQTGYDRAKQEIEAHYAEVARKAAASKASKPPRSAGRCRNSRAMGELLDRA